MSQKVREVLIGDRKIGDGNPCFIIAEISGNHHQKYEEAVKLVRVAAETGADAVKFQTYTPDTITLNSDREWFIVGGKDQPDSWKNRTLYDLYKTAYTPWEWQPKLKELAESLGLLFFSSSFDNTAVDFLESMGVLLHKIASYEAVHIPLLRKVAQTGKPVIISIGFASEDEASLAVQTLQDNGSGEIAVLHCITAYSDKPKFEHANLNTVADIRKRFGVLGGFSDNNSGIEIPVIAAVVAGASVIEKHLIWDRSLGGPDARFSIEPAEFKEMVQIIRKAENEDRGVLRDIVSDEDIKLAMGSIYYGPASAQEAENMFFRPSIWAKRNIKMGEEFSEENIRVARPSAGLPPKFFADVHGKRASHNIEEATPFSWDLIS